MKKNSTRDVNNPSFEELKEALQRQASDQQEARKLLKETIVFRLAWRLFGDASSKNLSKKGKNFYVPKIKRVTLADNVKNRENSLYGVEGKKVKERKNNNNKRRFINVGIEPPPDMPNGLKKYIEERGGYEIKLAIMKKLFSADLDSHYNRLSIPVIQMRDDSVLTEEEKAFIQVYDKTKKEHKPGLNVVLLDPSMHESEQSLKTWNINTDAYVLTSNWNSVVERHKETLKIGTIVQLWSFRQPRSTSSSSSSSQQQSNRFFLRNKTPVMATNLGFVLVIVDIGKGGKEEDDNGASTSGTAPVVTEGPKD